MIAIGCLIGILLLSAAIGRTLLHLLGILPLQRIDRVTFSVAVGLGIVAYLVFLLGLLGLLTVSAVVAAFVVLFAASWRGLRDMGRDLLDGLCGRARVGIGSIAVGLLLAVIGLIALVNAFVPPGSHEWDALSYHLAAPKIFIENHRIVYLPTDHHSNFPFLMQMLFAVGLLFDGFALAALFHLATTVLCVMAILGMGRRYFSPLAGPIGAVVFATTPIVIWEAGAAYTEMGFSLYVLLAVAAALEFRLNKDPRWLALSGVFMGFALSSKTLALAPFFLIGALLLWERVRFKNLRWYLLGAILVGCPFYIKTWVWTGNPVYPFAYRVFGGRDWSTELADAYATEQRSFGLNRTLETVSDDLRNYRPGYRPPSIVDRMRNLLLAPFALVAIPRIYYNYNDPGVHSQLGFLFVALPPLLLTAGGASSSARWCTVLVALWFVVWSQTMQYVRYMIPLLPLLALMGGEGAERAATRWPFMRGLVGACLLLQASLALAYFGSALSQRFTIATNAEAREQYLTRRINVYAAEQWINRNTPPDAGVILFEETRGFFLDRPYLWGNSLHSLYIPYHQFANGEEMVDWFLAKGYRYALVNLQFAPGVAVPGGLERLREALQNRTEAALFMEWYHPHRTVGERWRKLLGDAVLSGRAVFVPEAGSRGVVVLEFRKKS